MYDLLTAFGTYGLHQVSMWAAGTNKKRHKEPDQSDPACKTQSEATAEQMHAGY